MNAIRLSFSLWLLAGGSSALAAAQVHDCDRLAAFGPDPQAVAPGVDLGAIDAGAAIWACRAAIEADSEEPRFRYQLGRALLAKSEETQAFEAIKAVAERFYPAALNSLGYLYLHGMGTAPDPAAALVWYRRGADAGNSVSLNMVGRFYENGWGVDPDDAEALRWFQRAAEAGNAPAMNNVGLFHQFGRGTAQDSILARRWFRNAAEAGAPAGMNNLGVMYYSGYGGLEVDQAEAFGWYVKAAERGYHFAKNNLGEMYEDGETVEADPAKARQLYRHAADQAGRFCAS